MQHLRHSVTTQYPAPSPPGTSLHEDISRVQLRAVKSSLQSDYLPFQARLSSTIHLSMQTGPSGGEYPDLCLSLRSTYDY